jgi:hypothetical protein
MKTIQEYLNSVSEDKKDAFFKLSPKGYHCNPEQALPFISIAAQKNFALFYF